VFTAAIFTKFSQLILRKIIKIVATRCQILRLKCTKFDFRLIISLQRSPDPLAGFKGPTSKGRGEREVGGKGRRRKGRKGREGKGRNGDSFGPRSCPPTFLRIYAHDRKESREC